MCEALSAISTPTVAVPTPRRLVAEESAYVGAAVTGLSPGGAARGCPAGPKKSGRKKRPPVRYAAFYEGFAPSLSIRDGEFPAADVQNAVTGPISARAPWSSAAPPST